MVEIIKFSGEFNLLGKDDKKMIRQLFMSYYKKVKPKLSNEISMELFLKDYKITGKSKKYSIEFKLITSADMLQVSVSDWDFKKAIHKATDKMSNEIEHKFHVSDQHDK